DSHGGACIPGRGGRWTVGDRGVPRGGRRPASAASLRRHSRPATSGKLADPRLAAHDGVVHGLLAWRTPGGAVSEAGKVEAGEQGLSGTQKARGHGHVQLVDQAGLEILPDGGGTPEQTDVPVAGRG